MSLTPRPTRMCIQDVLGLAEMPWAGQGTPSVVTRKEPCPPRGWPATPSQLACRRQCRSGATESARATESAVRWRVLGQVSAARPLPSISCAYGASVPGSCGS